MIWLEQLDEHEIEQSLLDEAIFKDSRDIITYDEIGAAIALSKARDEFYAGNSVWDRTNQEFRLLLCTQDKKYNNLRKKLQTLSGQSSLALVALISSSTSKYIGTAVTVIAPLISLLMLAVTRIGVEAYCARTDLDIPIKSVADRHKNKNHG